VQRSLDCEQKTVKSYRANLGLLLSSGPQFLGCEIVKRGGSSLS